MRTDLGTVNRNRRALVPTSRESDDNDRWTPPVRVSMTSDIATPTLLIAGRAASCVLQCQTPPRVHYNCVADIHWEYVVRTVCLAAPHSHDADGDSSIWFLLDVYGSGALASVVLDHVVWVCVMEYG